MSRVDRASTTPFLIRVFHRPGTFERPDVLRRRRQQQPREEICLYAWKDATLAELTRMLSGLVMRQGGGGGGGGGDSPDRTPSRGGYRLAFRLVYWDNDRGRYETKDVGVIPVGGGGGGGAAKSSPDGDKTLEDIRFVIGDWLDVAVLRPGDRLFDTRASLGDSRHAHGTTGGHRGRGGAPSSAGDRYSRPGERPPRRSMESRIPYRRHAADRDDRGRGVNGGRW